MTDPRHHSIAARGIRATLDLALGQMVSLIVTRDGREIAPFWRVPWADLPDNATRFDPDTPPHLRALSGDFFCAPFVLDDIEDAPPHGWSANSEWLLEDERPLQDGVEAVFVLRKRIAGAVLRKHWVLRDDHPFLYQRHVFHGGARPIPVAHHAMIDLGQGGTLRLSPRLRAETPGAPLEPTSLLAYPATSMDLHAFPGRDGPLDLLRYPIGPAHEDFVTLIDMPYPAVSWAVVTRAQGDAALSLKRADRLPQTMLWYSNGGRDYAPWNGEHIGVLGLEEACTYGPHGWRASIADNDWTREGIATAVDLTAAQEVSVSVALGALPVRGDAVTLDTIGEVLTLSDGSQAPFDPAFLDG